MSGENEPAKLNKKMMKKHVSKAQKKCTRDKNIHTARTSIPKSRNTSRSMEGDSRKAEGKRTTEKAGKTRNRSPPEPKIQEMELLVETALDEAGGKS